uniref:Uncharacterized protein n=1 Tax=Globisporangium ultimum (strain ATCC 200006 / CBS 805.95 / DAOM BR144) TaxID=431595 RepID=K3XAU6_GLOUD
MSHSLPEGWFESGHGSIVVFVKDFRDPLERKKKLILKPWAIVKDIKDQLQVVFNVPTNAQKLFYQGRELKNVHNLQECGIYQDSAVIDFVARRQQNFNVLYSTNADATTGANDSVVTCTSSTMFMKKMNTSSSKLSMPPTRLSSSTSKPRENVLPHQAPVINIHPYGAHLLPISLMKITHQALQGLALGLAPVLAMDGTGGTYFFKDPSHRNVGCFKPQDEEPFGPYNPRGLVGELGQSGLRRGILSGEACERELAAYLLDKDHFAGVPATSLVEARHPVFKYGDGGPHHFKVGSLQEFVRHDDVVSDLAPNQFTLHQVHKIVLLDMRLLNTDRNDANILVRKKRSATTGQVEHELIPIDHGYCLPQYLEIAWCDWCWYNWPQLRQPLSSEDRKYILSLSAFEDTETLSKKIPLRRACRRNMIIAGMIVQKGVRANLVLYDIARIMCREDLDAPSVLETMCIEAFHQVIAQRKLNEQPHSSSPSPSSSAPPSPPNGKKPNLRLSIDISAPRESFSGGQSPVGSGAQSPPGFWASFAPFSAFDDDNEDEDEDSDSSLNDKLKQKQPHADMSWDKLVSNALSDAAKHIGNDCKANGTACSQNGVDHSTSNGHHSPGSSFGADPEKDEFEVLNETLDESVQDEKVFFGILSRLMDERVECVRRQAQQVPPSSSSSSRR